MSQTQRGPRRLRWLSRAPKPEDANEDPRASWPRQGVPLSSQRSPFLPTLDPKLWASTFFSWLLPWQVTESAQASHTIPQHLCPQHQVQRPELQKWPHVTQALPFVPCAQWLCAVTTIHRPPLGRTQGPGHAQSFLKDRLRREAWPLWSCRNASPRF